MISLFIDTSLINVSISIIKDGKVLSLIQKDVPNMHSKYTTKFVKMALDEANIDANMVDNIMVVVGPGSFTGIRIGTTIAKTYGFLIDREITPISSLKSLAISANHDGIVMSIIPANKTKYYVGVYDKEYNDLIKEVCTDKEGILKLCGEYNPYIVSNEMSVIGTYKLNKQELDILHIVDYYSKEERVNPHKLVPNYLKLPQALEGRND